MELDIVFYCRDKAIFVISPVLKEAQVLDRSKPNVELSDWARNFCGRPTWGIVLECHCGNLDLNFTLKYEI